MRITEARAITLLPPAAPIATKRASVHPTLKPVCPVRMAEAAAAEEEFADLCEEVSRVVRKPPPAAAAAEPEKASRPARPRALRKVAG